MLSEFPSYFPFVHRYGKSSSVRIIKVPNTGGDTTITGSTEQLLSQLTVNNHHILAITIHETATNLAADPFFFF